MQVVRLKRIEPHRDIFARSCVSFYDELCGNFCGEMCSDPCNLQEISGCSNNQRQMELEEERGSESSSSNSRQTYMYRDYKYEVFFQLTSDIYSWTCEVHFTFQRFRQQMNSHTRAEEKTQSLGMSAALLAQYRQTQFGWLSTALLAPSPDQKCARRTLSSLWSFFFKHSGVVVLFRAERDVSKIMVVAIQIIIVFYRGCRFCSVAKLSLSRSSFTSAQNIEFQGELGIIAFEQSPILSGVLYFR